jgi:hypothetical protein
VSCPEPPGLIDHAGSLPLFRQAEAANAARAQTNRMVWLDSGLREAKRRGCAAPGD